MRFFLILTTAACVSAFSTPSAAAAPKPEQSWAQCAWENVPSTAANWASIKDAWKIGLHADAEPKVNLMFRLRAACKERLATSYGGTAPAFDSKKVWRLLNKTMPDHIGADKFDPRAFYCASFLEAPSGKKMAVNYRWGYGEDTEKHQFTKMSFILPGNHKTTPMQCWYIDNDGSLSDA